jgi:hypothetical protein
MQSKDYPYAIIFIAAIILFFAVCMLSEYGQFNEEQRAIIEQSGQVKVHPAIE